jgi:nucleotide-binding universal stress UspA family protein
VSSLPFSHVLVAIDGSQFAEAALRAAVQLARDYGSRLTVLHVAMTVPRSSTEVSVTAARRAEASARERGEQLLELASGVAAGVTHFAVELAFGNPADVICSRGQALGVDLIVVGSRGLGLLDRVMLGSVSSAVVNCARCPVLVVRSPNRSSR